MRIKHIISLFTVASALLTAVADEPQTSAMASGRWVKIRVDADGVYELSHDRLRELGFSNPERVQVYGYAPTLLLSLQESAIPADMAPVHSVNDSGKIVFYLRGNADVAAEFWADNYISNNLHTVHAHSRGATYFLSDADISAARISYIPAPDEETIDSTTPLTSHTALIYHEKDVQNLSNGGTWFCDETFTPTARPFSLQTGKSAESRNAQFVWSTLFTVGGGTNYLVPDYSNGITADESTGVQSVISDSHQYFGRAMRRQPLQLPEVATLDAFNFDITFSENPKAAKSSKFAIDYFALLYERRNDLSGERFMQMYFNPANEPSTFALAGIDNAAEWLVWDVSDPLAIKQLDLTESTTYGHVATLTTDGHTPTEVVVFNPNESLPEPEIIGQADNQNLHAMTTPDLVILCSAKTADAANVAAEYHRTRNNFTVEVVDQQQIFNEYGSGNTSPEAVRRFISHLNAKNPGRLQALIIVGPATFDSPHLIAPENEYVITAETDDYFLSPTATRNFFSDAYFGATSELKSGDLWSSRSNFLRVFGSGVQIPVGRLPMVSPLDVRTYYNKVDSYLANTHSSPMAANILLASDYADANIDQHMTNAEALAYALGESMGTTVTVTRAASNIYSIQNNTINRRVMTSALERGTLMFAYFGHGSNYQIGGSTKTTDYLIHQKDIAAMSHKGRYPLFYFGSCNTGAIDLFNNTLATETILRENSGGIVSIASGREVYQDSNQRLGELIAGKLYSAKTGETLGSIWTDALNEATLTKNESRDRICNFLSYNFFGDPTIPAFTTSGSVAMTLAKGSAITAGQSNTLTGRILNEKGSLRTDFNGTVMLSIYDTPRKMSNLAKDSNPHPSYIESVDEEHELLAEYSVPVSGGQFSLTFTGPYSATTGTHRIHAYAYSADGTTRSIGYISGLELIDDASEMPVYPDVEPIKILSFTAGNGQADELIDGRTTFYAEIKAPAGLATGSALVNPLRLQIDGTVSTSLRNSIAASTDGKYTLSYIGPTLTGGRHEATLAIKDAAGNWDEATIQFFTADAPEAQLSAAVSGNEVTFELASEISEPKAHRLIIEHLDGETAKAIDVESFPVSLTLAPGAYRAFVMQEGTRSYASSPKVELLIEE